VNRTVKHITSGGLLIAVTAGLVLLAPARDSAAEEWLRVPSGGVMRTDLRPVSMDMLKGFLDALELTPQYRWTVALQPDLVQAHIEKWQRDLGVQLRPQTTEAWAWWVRDLPPLHVASDPPQEIQLDFFTYYKQTVPMLTVVNESGARGFVPQFRVPADSQRQFRFKFVWAVDIMDPANMPIDRFTAQNQDLTSVVRDLCERGKLGYSFRQDAGDRISISLDIRNRSVVDCLNAAAAAAGWKVSYAPGGTGIRNDRIFVPDLLKAAMEAQMEAGPPAATQLVPPVPDALTALRQAVKEAAQDTLKSRPTAILLPDTREKQ
jgi:hypothetical protein